MRKEQKLQIQPYPHFDGIYAVVKTASKKAKPEVIFTGTKKECEFKRANLLYGR